METAGSKGKRAILFGVLAVLAATPIVPAGGAIGNAIASAHSNNLILQADSGVDYAYGMNGTTPVSLPIADLNNTTVISSLQVGTHTVGVAGANNTTLNETEPLYSTTIYMKNNVTVSQLNAYDVSKIVLTMDVNETFNETLGFETNVSNFVP